MSIYLSSCLSHKDITVGSSVLTNDLSMMNGTYNNIAVNSKVPQDYSSLYLLLFKNYHYQYPSYNDSADYTGSIRLTAIADNKLKIERLIDGEIVKTKTLKGKIQDNCFLTKRKWRVVGIPILLGGYEESMMTIGLCQNGYINIKKAFYNIGGVIAIGANSNTNFNNIYFGKTDSNKRDIYNKTIEFGKALSERNPDKQIFYKTELFSVDSYIWYYKNDSIVSYKISPYGLTEKNIFDNSKDKLLMKRSTANLMERLPAQDKFVIGYFEFVNDKVTQYGMEVSKDYLSYSIYDLEGSDFRRKVNEALITIREAHTISRRKK